MSAPILNQSTLTSNDDSTRARGDAFAELERGVYAALETYSNVHRGSGHHSMVSTHLFEQARQIVLEYLGLAQDQYAVIFCTRHRAEMLASQLESESYRSISSQELGLPLGVRALAVERQALTPHMRFESGGGTAKLVSARWAIWADAPDKFEGGTPAIVNVIAFAQALRLIQHFGNNIFRTVAVAMEPHDVTSMADEILHHDEFEGYAGQKLLVELGRTLIGGGVRVPTAAGARPYIHLDNAASTRTFSPIWDAARWTWQQPPSVQSEIIRQVKAICADFLGAPLTDYDVLFTSNTTEAINLVAENLRSLASPLECSEEPVVLNTGLEHNSNELPWRRIPGLALVRLPVDADGLIPLGELEAVLCAFNEKHQHGQKRIKLVAVSGASNVLGTFSDLAAIGRIVHRYGADLLVDAAQLVAHRKVNLDECGIDSLAFSAHKAYAPFGTGVLIVRKGRLNLTPAQREQIVASGEENAGGIAALGKALVLLRRIGLDVIEKEERVLTERALRALARIPGIELFGIQDPSSPQFSQKGGIITFSLRHVPHNLVAKELAEQAGIGVRNGCFCAHLLVKQLLKIHPLRARGADLYMILAPHTAAAMQTGLVRMSLGIENDAADMDAFVCALDEIARRPRAYTDRLTAYFHGGSAHLPSTPIQHQMNDFVASATQRVYSLDA